MSLLAIEVAVYGEERNQSHVLIDVLMTRGCVLGIVVLLLVLIPSLLHHIHGSYM